MEIGEVDDEELEDKVQTVEPGMATRGGEAGGGVASHST